MSRILINDIKIGIGDGGIACSIVGGAFIVAINFTKDNENFWLYNVDTDGIPSICLTKDDYFDLFLSNDDSIPEIIDKNELKEYENINLDFCDYDDILKQLVKTSNDDAPLVKLLIYLTNCNENSVEFVKSALVGKYLNDVDYRSNDKFSEEYDEWVAWRLNNNDELRQRYLDRIHNQYSHCEK